MNYSTIRDNHKRGTVGDFLKDAITEHSEVAIVSAYFTIYAYHHLKSQLDGIKRLRFLFGEPTFLKSMNPDLILPKDFNIEDNEIALHQRLSQNAVARECAEWLNAKADIRSMVKPNFLHGKLYHVTQASTKEKAIVGSSNFTTHGLGLGKSKNIELNLVVAIDHGREELKEWFDALWNDKTGLVEDVKASVLKYLEQLYVENAPEFIYFKTLYHIFGGFIEEQQRGGLLDEKTGFFDTDIWNALYDFQQDGVRGAINKILTHNGCIIADSVGLGKTFEALAIIKYFELASYRKVLVICPKKLAGNWTIYQANQNHALNPFKKDRFGYTVLYHTDMGRVRGKSDANAIDLETFDWNAYELVVIDESHNFRGNPVEKTLKDGSSKLNRAQWLMEKVIKAGPNTRVLMLSATPVNTSLRDLRNQIAFITGGRDAALLESCQIKDIGLTLKNAQTHFTNWADPKKNPQRKTTQLLERLDSSFFKLLDALTIARSRKHIKNFYNIAAIGAFPERNKPHSVYPEIDTAQRFPSYDRINKQILEYKLSLFNPSAYVRPEHRQKYETLAGTEVLSFTQAARERFLIGMMKVNYLKRLESSIESFEISLDRMLRKIERLETKIAEFLASKQAAQRESLESMTPDDEELEENGEDAEQWQVGQKLKFDLADLDLERWRQDLNNDKDALIDLFNNAKAVTPDRDAKLNALKTLIAQKIAQPLNPGNRKVIVFTAFADTAQYLYTHLKAWYQQSDLASKHAFPSSEGQGVGEASGGSHSSKTHPQPLPGGEITVADPQGHPAVRRGPGGEVRHCALVCGSYTQTTFGRNDYDSILLNFSPRSKNRVKIAAAPQDAEIDLLIATDCISEGQNLQDCDYLINYDIHWNPVRIIQRFGRIDRIGSKNAAIQLVNFWPTKDLDNYINLKERVEARMALVDVTATGEDNVLNAEQIEELVTDDLKYRNQQLKKLKDEVLDLEDMDESVSLTDFTLDDFRVELMNFIEQNRAKLAAAPLGLYAVVPAPQSADSPPGRGKGWAADFDDIHAVNNPPQPLPEGESGGFAAQSEVSDIIKPGVIFCLRHKDAAEGNATVNQLSPYFLAYIRNDGTVRFNYTNAKQILEIYRMLCQGKTAPYEALCDLFNDETQHGANMDVYTTLLKKTAEEIIRVFHKRGGQRLTADRGGLLFPIAQQVQELEHFELVTWLIIR